MSTVPKNFDIHPQLIRLLKQRKEMVENSSIDWALAEALAIGSLLQVTFILYYCIDVLLVNSYSL